MAAGAGAGEAGLCDAVLLAPLTEETFVHNLHVRYKRDVIYTYVGAALVCVNPCRPLPLYTPELVRAHLARPPYTLPPHLYAITATAYRWVRDRNESQCIVITGESGSGKTEAARVCLQCVVLAGGAAGAGGALVAAGTLLEAFGNAATPINHNASRFGKLLDIEFNFKGEPIGGHITHYLLEKERVCRISEDERNFHVFYQLLAGADVQLLKRLKLQRSAMCYRVLVGSCGGAPPRTPHPAPRPISRQDTKHFQHTKDAMARVGVCASRVLRVLAFILKLGNAEFEPTHNIDGSIGTHLHHHYEVWEACELVGVDARSLLLALGAEPASLDAPAHTPDHADSEPGADQAEGSAEWARSLRDRLISTVYSRLFTWLVGAANQALQSDGTTRTAELGILDAYGFESLSHNGLERLLINYCAERVQAAVTGATLRREQREYCREGLPWRALPYLDHEANAELLDHGPESLLGILGDVSAKGLDDDTFIQRLQRKRDRRLLVLPPDHFHAVSFACRHSTTAGGAMTWSEVAPHLLIIGVLFPAVNGRST
ncbi:unnamed protein product [Plutella xylostella]|uniref:(diamondback moth) hypothetical protein n=1 Tax=Plutella xylostella TaxID=51655 RepID=A0A8S4EXA3_PLUXY|nr:unnamed protein product [Plutella xylostella]